MKKYAAEFVGTLLLVVVGVGTAVFDGKAVGALGISLAFGLVLVALVYAIGPISGAHVNPAVTIGAAVAGRMKWSDVIPYWIAQFLGGICGFGFLATILLGAPGASDPAFIHTSAAAVSNGFGDHSPNGLWYGGSVCYRSAPNVCFGVHRLGLDGCISSKWLCRHSHRAGARSCQSRRHSHHQRLHQPGTQPRSGYLRR